MAVRSEGDGHEEESIHPPDHKDSIHTSSMQIEDCKVWIRVHGQRGWKRKSFVTAGLMATRSGYIFPLPPPPCKLSSRNCRFLSFMPAVTESLNERLKGERGLERENKKENPVNEWHKGFSFSLSQPLLTKKHNIPFPSLLLGCNRQAKELRLHLDKSRKEGKKECVSGTRLVLRPKGEWVPDTKPLGHFLSFSFGLETERKKGKRVSCGLEAYTSSIFPWLELYHFQFQIESCSSHEIDGVRKEK